MNSVWVRSAASVLGLAVLVTAVVVMLTRTPSETNDALAHPSATILTTTRIDPTEVYDPVRAGELAPPGFRQLLDRDQILPVYDPVFTSASLVDWPVGMLVIGVSGEQTAKAYPVTHLNQREMVIDSLDGIPLLVTW
jgi:hypothetical protein